MVFFRGREMSRLEFGRKVLDRLVEDLKDIALVDSPPKMEGRNMSLVLSPKPEVVKKAQQIKQDARDVKAEEREPQEQDDVDAPETAEESTIE
jgi:translation initiation factor IF-3